MLRSWLSLELADYIKNECKAVKLCGTDIPYESSTRCLDVFLCAAKQFNMSVKQAKASFYKSLNLLLSRGKGKFDDIVMLYLIKTFCLLVLLYGFECLYCTSSYVWLLHNTVVESIGSCFKLMIVRLVSFVAQWIWWQLMMLFLTGVASLDSRCSVQYCGAWFSHHYSVSVIKQVWVNH